ncbi:MAG: 5'-methylthioadenosine/S-adenosylhomocysteine nucleosidase [candidate division Zixibacteria bacterium]|nr:5'-methylthioadenosine/S-adenosylhomocysteine nucleosidase [candidate division Zixibacteria bacterium]
MNISRPSHTRSILFLLGITVAAVIWGGCTADRTDRQTIMILYAFPAEGELLARQIAVDHSDTVLGRPVHVGVIKGKDIVLAESGVGMTNAAMTTQSLLDRYHPRCVIFTGIAGAIDTSVRVGDIVICDRWITHDYGYYGPNDFEPGDIEAYSPDHDSMVDFSSFAVDSGLFAHAGRLAESAPALDPIGERMPRLQVGGVGVSGNSFIDNRNKRHWLSSTFKAQVTDMESAAVAQVCTANDVPCIIFRSASDLAGGTDSGTARDELSRFFKVAARNSARLVLDYIDLL